LFKNTLNTTVFPEENTLNSQKGVQVKSKSPKLSHNRSILVDDVTFFDFLRVKHLGGNPDLGNFSRRVGYLSPRNILDSQEPPKQDEGERENSPPAQSPAQSEEVVPKSFQANLAALPREAQGSDLLKTSPQTTQKLAPQLAPKTAPQLVPKTTQPKTAQPKTTQQKTAQQVSPKIAQLSTPETTSKDPQVEKESSLVLCLKWLTKLILSLLFVFWIFILGVLVGRGSILNVTPFSLEGENLKALEIIEDGLDSDGSVRGEDLPYLPLNPLGSGDVLESPSPNFAENTLFPNIREAQLLKVYGNTSSIPIPTNVPNANTSTRVEQTPVGSNPRVNSPNANSPNTDSLASGPNGSHYYGGSSSENTSNPQVFRSSQTGYDYQSEPTLATFAEDTRYYPGPPKGQGSYTIQIGAPHEEAIARQMVEKFLALGFLAYYYEKSPTLFPVRVGRYETREEAEGFLGRLENLGIKGPYVSKLNPA
jgi:cell division septation protein DedD